MRLEKLVRDAVLGTLAAVIGLLIFMLSALCVFFPSTMMEMTYDFGMDEMSIRFAKRAYKSTNEITYIAHATEVAVELDDEAEIFYCAEQFIADDQFEEYCVNRNKEFSKEIRGTYEQYVYGQLCVAMYELGNRTEAVERAFALLSDGFPQNNVVAAVAITALRVGDVEITQQIRVKIEQVQVEGLSEIDRAYYDGLLALMQ